MGIGAVGIQQYSTGTEQLNIIQARKREKKKRFAVGNISRQASRFAYIYACFVF